MLAATDLLPEKVVHSKREKDRKIKKAVDEGMEKSNYTEEQIAFALKRVEL